LSIAQTVVKFDNKSKDAQGISFDVPLVFQFPVDIKIKPLNVSYMVIPKSISRKYGRKLNDYLKPGPHYDTTLNQYYFEILNSIKSSPLIPISLGSNDTLSKNSDANGSKYLLTTSQPVFLTSNKNYLFLLIYNLFNSTADSKIFVRILKSFQNAHELLHPSQITNLELSLLSANYKNSQQIWHNINQEYSSNIISEDSLESALKSYQHFWNTYKENYNTPTINIPYFDSKDTTSANSFFRLYKLFINTLQIDYDLKKEINNITKIEPPNFKNCDCLNEIIDLTFSCCCNKVDQQVCKYTKDTSDFTNFLISLVEDDVENPFIKFLKTSNSIFNVSVFNFEDDNYSDTLKTIRTWVTKLKNIIWISHLDTSEYSHSCSIFEGKIDSAKVMIDNEIKAYEQIKKSSVDFYKILNSDEDFTSYKLYSGDSYVYSLSTRNGFRLTSDIGVIDYGIIPNYSFNLERIVPYFGVHLNWKYVQTDVPFSQIPHNGFLNPRRFSNFIGITYFSVKEPGKFDNLFNKSALLLGFGYKFTNALRLVVGSMAVKKNDPNPLITSTKLSFLPFLGISFDSNDIFKSITSLLK